MKGVFSSSPALAMVTLLACVSVLACANPEPEEQAHFPIMALHRDLSCSDCHQQANKLNDTPNSCDGCHENNRPAEHYQGNCRGCHSEDGWQYAVAEHSFLATDGGHLYLTCLSCHEADDFTTLDAACASCHADDSPPNHFGSSCEGCHTVDSWPDADFDHREFFPLPHEGVRECERCHVNPDDYAVFTCTDCHAHRRDRMDPEHRGINNYQYLSTACLGCHPRGDD